MKASIKSEIDKKTGLYNKTAFCRKSAQIMQANPDTDYMILRWDIDRFKVFNELYGIKAGNELLALIGKTVLQHLDDNLIYGHWEADHFVICLSKQYFLKHQILQQILDYHFSLTQEFELFISIGIYEVQDHTIAVELMCDRALLALQSIKGNFMTHFAYYHDSMRTTLLEEQEIVGKMRQALISRQFVTYLQPQYDYNSGKIIGAEALVRWRHPEKGLILPNKFIPIFERNGFISKLDEYICREVCQQLRIWINAGLSVLPISINISRKDIYNPDMIKKLIFAMQKYNIPTELLRLEITESAYIEDTEQLIEIVEILHNHGLAIEMDDFGSGYSSLNTLKIMPVDKIKLDIKFLERRSKKDTKGKKILSSIIHMANWLRLPVIAEGVETKEQAEYLKSIGCLHMQGYLFARPMPMEDFRFLLEN